MNPPFTILRHIRGITLTLVFIPLIKVLCFVLFFPMVRQILSVCKWSDPSTVRPDFPNRA